MKSGKSFLAKSLRSTQEQLDSLTSAAKDLQQRGELQPPPEELLEISGGELRVAFYLGLLGAQHLELLDAEFIYPLVI